jgi:drug/metabolite transporter (DMT)-like permease
LPILAFVLVLIAAFAHSTWNFLAKRAAHAKHLIWMSSALEAALFSPLAAWILAISWPHLSLKAGAFLIATGVLHVLYSESLLHGYRAGDLSVVYPLARGTGPLLAFLGAVVIMRERASLLAVIGALLVTSGILISSGGSGASVASIRRRAIWWGTATGFTIAAYTLVDGYSVKALLISPILVEYAGNLFRMIVFSPRAFRERASLVTEYRRYRLDALGIAMLTPAGYILVLFAMTMAPISHVAPVREMSMVIGAFWGTRLLNEGNAKRRIAGSALIAIGVASLAVG